MFLSLGLSQNRGPPQNYWFHSNLPLDKSRKDTPRLAGAQQGINEGMTAINHLLWFPWAPKPGCIQPQSLLVAASQVSLHL